jgi:drug/metabolite transporter (DMT)-like permease
MTLSGMALAMMAIVLVSQTPLVSNGIPRSRRSARAALVMAIASGIAVGIFFLALARTSPDAGMWPLLAARGASAALFAVMAVTGGHGRLRMPMAVAPMAVACGVIDMLANALYLAATRGGALSVIVTLASLYPASTVLLAGVVLRERLGRVQIAGVAACLAAIVLIVAG